MLEFKNKVLIIGYGSVSKCTLPILLKHIDIPCKNITIIDLLDKRKELNGWIRKGVRYYQVKYPSQVQKTQQPYYNFRKRSYGRYFGRGRF